MGPDVILAFSMVAVSAVISTFQRPDACERALLSVLAQDPAPLEVLVCDDGSGDETPERFRAWQRRDPRVRYVRIEPNRGTPGPARNEGVAQARGDWIGFLDDDDVWLPGKLAAQLECADSADVIGSNAVKTDGALYFLDAVGARRPGRDEILAANPVILSSALVGRTTLLAAGGFPTAHWMRGIEDYAAWLALAELGARFLVLGAPLIEYAVHEGDRFSNASARIQLATARLGWRSLRSHPDPVTLRAALNKSVAAAEAVKRART